MEGGDCQKKGRQEQTLCSGLFAAVGHMTAAAVYSVSSIG